MNITEKVAYLKGLAEGMGVGEDTKEGKLFSVIIDILEDIAQELDDLGENAEDLGEMIDQISDDLALLEDEVYGDEDGDDEEDEDDESVFYSVRCASCGNAITVDEDVLDLGSMECPNCGKTIEFGSDTIEELDDDLEDIELED